ncbi:MAG: aspartate carbamoyltransferase catalytic subunit [Clostridiales bacterium]|jgi:aspartate carbamoyltransferase catalytic subunit|nr:aspartate carbamoyltransferase catalytic subunit [Clostridiales bacterium]
MDLSRKDFIALKYMSADEILHVLDTAETMKYLLDKKNKKAPHLNGKSMILLFYEPSVRTRLSYEMAGQFLSASVVNMEVSTLPENGGNLKEMGPLIDQMGVDFIVIRHPMSGSAELLAKYSKASVINAGDGLNENPAQSLMDLLTIRSHKKDFKGLKVTIIGDVAHSRVSRSNIWGLLKLGASLTISGPPTLIPPGIEEYGVKVCKDAREAATGADVIMSLRLKSERQQANLMPSQNEYRNFFKIDEEMLKCANKDAIVMHPGPINRGIEISTKVIESERCLVDDQITNGVAVRMAQLYILSLGNAKRETEGKK